MAFFLEPDWTPAHEFQLFTDAAGNLGYGAYWNCHWFSKPWPPNLLNKSIEWKELYAIVAACKVWGKHWSGKRLLFHCDNDAVMHIWLSGRSHCPDLMNLVRDLMDLVRDLMDLVRDLMDLVRDLMDLVRDLMDLVRDLMDLVRDLMDLVRDLMDLVRDLFFIAANNNFNEMIRHIPGINISIADALSRLQLSRFRALAPQDPHPSPTPAELMPALQPA